LLKGVVAPLNRLNVDTDQIIPKQYLKTIHRKGLKKGLFVDWARHPDGSVNQDFFLNQARYQGATILLAGENFGCGSSREHAPWALLDYGFQCIIAPSFADIFYNNCLQNGVLPVTLDPQDIQMLFDHVERTDGYQVTVDLHSQTVSMPDGRQVRFEIDSFQKECLLNGLDTIALTMREASGISEYEQRRMKETPWLFEDVMG